MMLVGGPPQLSLYSSILPVCVADPRVLVKLAVMPKPVTPTPLVPYRRTEAALLPLEEMLVLVSRKIP